MKKYFPLFPFFLLLISCGRFGEKETTTDGPRIVCLSKDLTEMLFALGKGNLIVGVDLSSTYPDSTRQIQTVGYHRALSAEGIISLKPYFAIHSNYTGHIPVNDQLIQQA